MKELYQTLYDYAKNINLVCCFMVTYGIFWDNSSIYISGFIGGLLTLIFMPLFAKLKELEE